MANQKCGRTSCLQQFFQRKWGDVSDYDLCLNANCIGTSDCADMIFHFLEHIKSAK